MTGHLRRLDTALLLRAYAAGLFPMADTRESADVFWVEPRRRGIIPLEGFHLSRSLARTLRREELHHSVDRAFELVISGCAERAEGREQSWINQSIEEAYCRLHAQGHAHSIEVWDGSGALVGGLYGVRLGAAFFGESMFSRVHDASKAALAHLVARLRLGGFHLLDTQFWTPHLGSLGAIEVKRSRYLSLLSEAVAAPADWGALDRFAVRAEGRSGGLSGTGIVQLLSQTS
jgi:leucyl/phenylalanyl-tRNA--protein transferase